VTDAVGFCRIEEEHLVGFGNGLVLSNMTYVGAAIGEDERCDPPMLFGAAVAACSPTVDVADGDCRRVEQKLGGDFGAGRGFAVRITGCRDAGLLRALSHSVMA